MSNKWVLWSNRLHRITGDLARYGPKATGDKLKEWAVELKAVAEEMEESLHHQG